MRKNVLLISGISLLLWWVISGFKSEVRMDLSHYQTSEQEICYYVPSQEEIPASSLNDDQYDLLLGKTYLGFKEALGFKESRGDYSVINRYGYLGKYQFGPSTLALIGIHDTAQFLVDSELQEQAFAANMSRNKWILRRDIARFEGKVIGGVRVTESGILAAAHLAGAGNVKKYLRSGGQHAFSDAFGTTIGYYLKKFSGYDTSFVVPNRQAKANVI